MAESGNHKWEEWRDLSEDEWKRKVLAEDDDYGKLVAASGYPGNMRFRRILEHVTTPLEASVCAQIIWAPRPAEDIAETLNLNTATVNKTLHSLHAKGLVHPRNFKTMEGFRYRLSTGKLHKSMLSDPALDSQYPKLRQLWDDFVKHEEGEWQCISRLRAYDQKQPEQRRILPAWRALAESPDSDQIQPWEDQRAIAAAAELCAEVSCSCRRQVSGSGGDCRRTGTQACLVFGREAEYALSRGIGRQLTGKELLSIMEQASYDGLGGSYINSRTVQSLTLCYCCDCCCHLWSAMNQRGISQEYRGWAKSRWQPVIDWERCSGCNGTGNTCADRCLWQAIEIQPVAGKATINADKCWGCGSCALWCQNEAITMRCIRPIEWVPEKADNLRPPIRWNPPRIAGLTLEEYFKKNTDK